MTESPETVSVVMPCYNGETYLRESIDSVLNQGHPISQLIVVDDGSTDRSAEIIQSYGAPVEYVYQENQGVGAALNTGAALATGTFLGFNSADDLWVQGKLGKQLACFAAQPELDMVFGYAEQFISPELTEEEQGTIQCPAEPMQGYLITVMLVRRAAYEKVGALLTHLEFGEFLDWYSRAQDAGLKHVLLPDLLFRRRLHKTNISLTQPENRANFAHVLKAAIDRKRKTGTTPS